MSAEKKIDMEAIYTQAHRRLVTVVKSSDLNGDDPQLVDVLVKGIAATLAHDRVEPGTKQFETLVRWLNILNTEDAP